MGGLAFLLATISVLSLCNGQAAFLQAIEFGIENRSENFLEVQPNRAALKTLDFTVCLRCKFWTWGSMIVFETGDVGIYLFLRSWELNFGSFFFSEVTKFQMSNLNISPTLWNSFCFIHNTTNSSITIAINNFMESYHLNTTDIHIEDISKTIFIGRRPNVASSMLRFSGQVADFNFWNMALISADVQDFISGCSEKLFER